MSGAVTASTQEAADAGVAILRAGGNAVDAAVAAALASCVADPCNTGIGGYGGYLVHQRSGERARCVAFPLCAPSGSRAPALARAYPEAGPECSSVPNVVAGLARAHAELGRLPWGRLFGPAIGLARGGVIANATNTRAFAETRHHPFMAECFAFEAAAGGLRFRQQDLAATLERMAGEGPTWFYEGPLAEAAAAAWRAAGIERSAGEWRGMPGSVLVEDAASFTIGSLRLEAAPLGLSGSACLFATVAAAERIARERALASAEGLAALAESMAAIWQYRFAMSRDASGESIARANDFRGVDLPDWIEAALAHAAAGEAREPEAAHTAHLNAVDPEGMMVALTFTHGPAWFGGRWAIPGTGVVMNGGMHNFTRAAPLERDGRLFGVSNMTPTVATTAEGERIAVGGPGARRIPSNIALVLASRCLAGEGLQAAVSAGRLHAESRDLAWWEAGRLPAAVGEALGARFARLEVETGESYFGPLTAVARSARGDIEVGIDDRAWQGFAAWGQVTF